MRVRRRQKKKPPGLMLTSLLDMFTIILIFLIVSFEAESHEFRLNPDLTLPESSARAQLKPAVNVAVTGQQVLVDNEPVYTLTNGAVPGEGDVEAIDEVVEALRAEYEKRFGHLGGDAASANEADETAEASEGAIVVVQADRELEYRTLYAILRSAATAGFFKYRLAIMRS
ncbi:MAG: biopolymer transporter ExbD [Myxococcota bacterium]